MSSPGRTMSKTMIGMLLAALLALPLAADAQEAAATAPDTKSIEQALTEFRDELQAIESEVVSKGVSLTTEEQTAFWPVFQKFQAEQKDIIDGQIAAVRDYAANFATLSGADSA